MKITGVIFSIIGVMLLGLGGYLFVRQHLFLQRAELTTAIVMENKLYTHTSQEYGVQHYYCSEFQFQTKAGQSVSFEETGCAQLDSPPDYQVGQKVDVYYDPRDPGKTVQTPMDRSYYEIGVMTATVAGALFVLLGPGLFWISLWRSRRTGISRIDHY